HFANRQSEERGNLPIFTGDVNGCSVIAFHTGIGGARAYEKTGAILARFKPRLLIGSGFAGALDPELRVADLVVANNVSNGYLVERLKTSGVACRIGNLVTTARVIDSLAAKTALHEKTGSIAVDMETESVARACAEANTLFLSVRAISDAAADSLPVPVESWFDLAAQRPLVIPLLAFLATHPARIPAFARFVAQVQKAKRALGTELPRIIAALD
ncbi:MAG: hypothetical protein M3O82_09145, partial [Verrucomicrobiota bacterium]|nr:hypothetical protein [Verrucomicrobiota bacterium]